MLTDQTHTWTMMDMWALHWIIYITNFSFFFFSLTDIALSLMMLSSSSATAIWDKDNFCSSNSWVLICLQNEYVGTIRPEFMGCFFCLKKKKEKISKHNNSECFIKYISTKSKCAQKYMDTTQFHYLLIIFIIMRA